MELVGNWLVRKIATGVFYWDDLSSNRIVPLHTLNAVCTPLAIKKELLYDKISCYRNNNEKLQSRKNNLTKKTKKTEKKTWQYVEYLVYYKYHERCLGEISWKIFII